LKSFHLEYLETLQMESNLTKWVIRVVGREDLVLTLHESKESALKECSILNRRFSDSFYVDEYELQKERV